MRSETTHTSLSLFCLFPFLSQGEYKSQHIPRPETLALCQLGQEQHASYPQISHLPPVCPKCSHGRANCRRTNGCWRAYETVSSVSPAGSLWLVWDPEQSRAQKPRLALSARGAGGGLAQCGQKYIGYIPVPCTIWCVDSACRQPWCLNCSLNSFSDISTIKK